MDLDNSLKTLIVESVDSTIRQLFPKKYFSLCHVYAIVGSNVASIILGCNYRPVAGLAVIDCGGGHFIKLLDNKAFFSGNGGAYHCWIESQPQDINDKELIDIPFKHNKTYANQHKIIWQKKNSNHLWGKFNKHVIDTDINSIPSMFPEGKIWLRETFEGHEWMSRQVKDHLDDYSKITSLSLKVLKVNSPFNK